MNPPSLGYVILYVNDVTASLAFYKKAFGLARRFSSGQTVAYVRDNSGFLVELCTPMP